MLTNRLCTLVAVNYLQSIQTTHFLCEMGRRKRQWKQRQRGNRDDQDERGWHPPAEKENASFVKFYQGLGIIPEGEWDQFESKMKETLPVTFRITGYKGQAQELLKIIKGHYFNKFVDVKVEGQQVDPPKCLQWYPDELAWQLDLTKRSIRANDQLKQLHEFLVSETESGNISRQEAVSMIPPLVLDIQPHHKILDMCAAPGSKTAQLIEYLHKDESTVLPEGFVVANDSDNKRCYLMTHQVKRLQSPNCMIINHDATILPNLFLSPESSSSQTSVVYDRVLADVPCSGDGTFRKNADMWRKWHPTMGTNLHGLQLRILKRGFELLTVGGRLVYSTCSLNPVEDEAVVAAILEKAEGAVELVEAESLLPGLRCMKGVSKWRCMTRKGEWFEKWEDIPEKFRSTFRPTMFQPSEETAAKINLDKCLRILPHHQDTGGFFIAVFKKAQQLPWQKSQRFENGKERVTADSAEENDQKTANDSSKTDTADENCTKQVAANDVSCTEVKDESKETNKANDVEMTPESKNSDNGNCEKDSEVSTEKTEGSELVQEDNKSGSEGTVDTSKADKRKAEAMEKAQAKKPKLGGFKEDPFFFLQDGDAFWPPIKSFFGVSDKFPQHQLMYRSADGKRQNLYFVSEHIKHIVQHNEDRVKFINLGVKILGRSPSPIVPDCHFRLAQEGLAVMHQFSSRRRLLLPRDDLVTLLVEENPYLVKMSCDVQEQANDLSPGSTIFHYVPKDSMSEPGCEIIVCGWKGKTSLRSFVGKFARAHYLRLCGLELSDVQRQVAEKKLQKQALKEDQENTEEEEKDETELVDTESVIPTEEG